MARRISSLARLAAVHLTTIAAVAVVAPIPASAEEALQLEVTASVANVCTIGVADGAPTGLDFGALTPGVEGVASTTLRVWCTFQSTPKVHVGNGEHFNTPDGRRLERVGGSDFLPYLVCHFDPTNNNCTEWDNSTSNVPVTGGEDGGQNVGIYGYISSSDTSSITQEGNFKDTLQVTVDL